MFRNVTPIFKRKYVLKKEMLENLPTRKLFSHPLSSFSCSFRFISQNTSLARLPKLPSILEAADTKLTVLPGIILFQGLPYYMEEPFELTCEAQGELTYLKVCFTDTHTKYAVPCLLYSMANHFFGKTLQYLLPDNRMSWRSIRHINPVYCIKLCNIVLKIYILCTESGALLQLEASNFQFSFVIRSLSVQINLSAVFLMLCCFFRIGKAYF